MNGALLGGLDQGAGNTVAHGLAGIVLGSTAHHVQVLSNSLYANRTKGINDDYREKRDGLEAPIVDSAKLGSGKLHLDLDVRTVKGVAYRVQLFVNPSCAGTDEASGRDWLTGHDETFTATKGSRRLSVTLPAKGIKTKMGLTALVTGADTTSAFSNCEPVR